MLTRVCKGSNGLYQFGPGVIRHGDRHGVWINIKPDDLKRRAQHLFSFVVRNSKIVEQSQKSSLFGW